MSTSEAWKLNVLDDFSPGPFFKCQFEVHKQVTSVTPATAEEMEFHLLYWTKYTYNWPERHKADQMIC